MGNSMDAALWWLIFFARNAVRGGEEENADLE